MLWKNISLTAPKTARCTAARTECLRLQRLEAGASLAFILARVAAWARNIIRRWPWKLIATVGVAVAFVLTLLFSLETRGEELVPQLTLVEQPA